ncbi:MAG: hypothetical protein WCI77_03890 [Candidatus Omnitrophota bacterium]
MKKYFLARFFIFILLLPLIGCVNDSAQERAKEKLGNISKLSNEELLKKYSEIDTQLNCYKMSSRPIPVDPTTSGVRGREMIPGLTGNAVMGLRSGGLKRHIETYTEAKRQLLIELKKRGVYP